MNDDTTMNTTAATLTEKELFQRFLDLPYDTSKFGDLDAPTIETIGETVKNGGLEAGGWPVDLREYVMDYLRDCDDPSNELQSFLNDTHGLLGDMKMLESGFEEFTLSARGISAVTITRQGKTYFGTYMVKDGIISIHYAGRSKATLVGGLAPEALAEMILGEMIDVRAA